MVKHGLESQNHELSAKFKHKSTLKHKLTKKIEIVSSCPQTFGALLQKKGRGRATAEDRWPPIAARHDAARRTGEEGTKPAAHHDAAHLDLREDRGR